MSDEADLLPILQDLTARIERIEQFLAASGLQDNSGFAPFNPLPASFNTPPAPGGGQVPDYLVMLARSGKQIQAIKELRSLTGMSLKDAKAVIDQVVRGY